MTQELLEKQLSEIKDYELVQKCRNQVRMLAKTGGTFICNENTCS